MKKQPTRAHVPLGNPVPSPQPNDLFLSVSPVPSAAGLARTFVEHRLNALGMADLVDDALVVVSELVTNAAREHREHRPTVPITVRLALTDEGRPRIEVTDRSPNMPRLRNASPVEESGRGLLLVTAIAREAGYKPVPGCGKTVWAVL
ncbi:ATP-binding protein [Thermomonospora cellulosilytica]|uniref:Anti-sigma regulatory factor (Ser/Thr protein kinase) n=1 Tax=Thermomonospora cellulosilytica TaxID=1411118 RepID=A0A7W3MST0_9ACTN|nr:ATP-binding protein [Thermomonospora cellulosilytica]MBA9001223.1 anti-sigma regulatory factor (Ser/Thr protein kinase) [Thermomonospora cellulosilytica]